MRNAHPIDRNTPAIAAAVLAFSAAAPAQSVTAWGFNSQGQCNVPALPAGATYVELAAGQYHTLLRRSDGGIVAFGDNSVGQCLIPTPPPGRACAELACGDNHTLARFDHTREVSSYCTSGTSSLGCVPAIFALGSPSASASSGFAIHVVGVEGQKQGLVFYGVSDRAGSVWGAGGTSYLCVKAPTQRMSVQSSGGGAGLCDGAILEDWRAFVASHPNALGSPLSAGQVVQAQGWFRDPPAPKTTSLSGGLEFTLRP